MDLQDFITKYQSQRPNADIAQRWNERIVRNGLNSNGEDGALEYLSLYGKGIGAQKCILLARQAELSGYPQVALGFWKKAFQLETGSIAKVDAALNAILGRTPSHQEPTVEKNIYAIDGFPSHLQPTQIITMQPADARKDQSFYVNSPFYWGQPKRDGKKLVLIASKTGSVYYQSRSTKLQDAPSRNFNYIAKEAAYELGSYVLEGELTFLDRDGGEHRTASQVDIYNRHNNMTNVYTSPVMKYCVFSALMFNGVDLSNNTQAVRIDAGEKITAWLRKESSTFEMVPTFRTKEEKMALVAMQESQHREGEIWFQPSIVYTGGKNTRDDIVRTKYLIEIKAVMTGLTATTADGRPFGAIMVSVDGKSAGKIGTGFDAATMAKVVERFNSRRREVNIVCQGFTENGQVWHGRLDPDVPFVD